MAAVFATNSGAPQLNSAVVGWGGKVQRGSAVLSQRGEEARQWGTGLGPDLVGTHRRKIIRGVPLRKEGVRASDRWESDAGCQRPGFTAASGRTG